MWCWSPAARAAQQQREGVPLLVTNAVKAAAGQDLPLPVRLRLSSDKDRLLIEVWDADPRPPVLPGLQDDGTPAPAEEGGRGLFLVATLSQRWNWYAPREWGGKVVWSELQLSAVWGAITRVRSCCAGFSRDRQAALWYSLISPLKVVRRLIRAVMSMASPGLCTSG